MQPVFEQCEDTPDGNQPVQNQTSFGMEKNVDGLCTDEMSHLLQSIQHVQPTETHREGQINIEILVEKILNNQSLTDSQLQQLSDEQRQQLHVLSEKMRQKQRRPDELQKNFFKKAFKYAVKKHFKRGKKTNRRMSNFYHYHFDKVALKYRLPIVNFYHPDKLTRPGLTIGQKSFSRSYIRLILSSDTFWNVTSEYHGMFVRECAKQRKQKINKFSQHLSMLRKKYEHDPGRILMYLKSSKCKIPWTDMDINRAWQTAQDNLMSAEGRSILADDYNFTGHQEQMGDYEIPSNGLSEEDTEVLLLEDHFVDRV